MPEQQEVARTGQIRINEDLGFVPREVEGWHLKAAFDLKGAIPNSRIGDVGYIGLFELDGRYRVVTTIYEGCLPSVEPKEQTLGAAFKLFTDIIARVLKTGRL